MLRNTTRFRGIAMWWAIFLAVEGLGSLGGERLGGGCRGAARGGGGAPDQSSCGVTRGVLARVGDARGSSLRPGVLMLRGGSSEVLPPHNERVPVPPLYDDEDEDEDQGDHGDGENGRFKFEDLERDELPGWKVPEHMEGAGGWEKLKAYWAEFEKNVGHTQVDNVGIEEYGPHTVGPDAGKDWVGRGAFSNYDVPWIERKLIGRLELPNGQVVDLREGDLPNRTPYYPDADELYQKPPRVRREPDRRPYDERYAGKDLKQLDHWVNRMDTDERDSMPPGGYELPSNITFDVDHELSSDHSESDFYEELRQEALYTYGRDAVPIVKQMDKLVNYSGMEPEEEGIDPERGEMTMRFDAEGNLDGIVPMEFDEPDCDLCQLGVEELNVKLWQYATDGRGNATRRVLEAGAEVNAVSEYTHTALHYASRKGWTPVISTLLEYGADVHVANEGDLTPLHYAAYYNHTPAVWMLLSAGADMNASSVHHFTPWDYAEDYHYRDMQILFRAFSRNATALWEDLYGDDYRESHHPGTFNSTPAMISGKYGSLGSDFADFGD